MNFPVPTPKQARVLWFAVTAVAVAVVLALIGVLCWGIGWILHRLSPVLVPMGVALILAYILNPVVEYFEKKKMPRLWAVCFVFGLGAIILVTVFGSVLPDLKRETRKLVDDAPRIAEISQSKIKYLLDESPFSRRVRSLVPSSSSPSTNTRNPMPPVRIETKTIAPPTNALTNIPSKTIPNAATNTNNVEISLNLKVTDPTDNVPKTNEVVISTNSNDLKAALDAPFSETLKPALARAGVAVAQWITIQFSKITTWAEFLIGLLLVPVYLFYFLLEKEQITRHWTDYLPIKESKAKDEIVFVTSAINECMIVFFRGQVLVALCVGALLTVGYLALGMNYAILLGMVAAVLGIVPYLGTITTLVLALTVAGVQFGDWAHPLYVVLLAIVVKLLEDFVIGPRIIGERAGLHPLTVILAVMIGTTLMGGFLGAMLAIPLTAALRTLMFRYIWTKGRHIKRPHQLNKEASS